MAQYPGTCPDRSHLIRSSFLRHPLSRFPQRRSPGGWRGKAELPLEGISGSGPRGRIVALDVRSHLDKPKGDAAIIRLYAPGTYDVVPVDAMRRTIAQRLTLSKQTVPHFYLTADLRSRETVKIYAPGPEAAPRKTLSINDFIIKAMALALKQVPDANVTWASDGIHRHRSAMSAWPSPSKAGCSRQWCAAAETKTLSQISKEMKDLATRARARKLLPAEYQGGTTTISNLGMYGIEQFTAIINPPQATILAVGAGIERFVPVNGLPVFRTQMTCTLSCDHRAVDGAPGAQLLAAFRTFIEEPALMLA